MAEEDSVDDVCQLDHRVPTAVFNMKNEDHRSAQTHHTNLHMMCAYGQEHAREKRNFMAQVGW